MILFMKMIEKDYLKEDQTGYASHIKPLSFIVENIEIRNAIEMGTGFFSTPFLLDFVKETLVSIEMQDKEWLKKVKERYTDYKINWVTFFTENPLAIKNFLIGDIFDFVFIDGSSISRPISVYLCMEKGINTIVAHDTESSWYGYDSLDGYADKYDYFEYEFTEEKPYTTIYTKDSKLIKALNELPILS